MKFVKKKMRKSSCPWQLSSVYGSRKLLWRNCHYPAQKKNTVSGLNRRQRSIARIQGYVRLGCSLTNGAIISQSSSSKGSNSRKVFAAVVVCQHFFPLCLSCYLPCCCFWKHLFRSFVAATALLFWGIGNFDHPGPNILGHKNNPAGQPTLLPKAAAAVADAAAANPLFPACLEAVDRRLPMSSLSPWCTKAVKGFFGAKAFNWKDYKCYQP